MKHKLLIILILLIGFISITGCGKEKTDAIKFKEEYESLNNKNINNQKVKIVTIDKDNPIIYKEAKDIIEMMDKKETFMVYFGYKESPWCRNMIETLLEVAKDYNMEKVYYVDIKDIRDEKIVDENGIITTKKEGTKDYYKLVNKLDILLDDYKIDEVSMEEKRITEPTVIAITNGTPFKITNGLSEEQKDPYQKITKEMKKVMYKNIECLAKCISEASTICTKNAC